MSDCYWFRHTLIAACLLVISIHHEWLLLVSTHADWCMTSCDFYSPWVIVFGFDTWWLMNDFLCFLFIMSDCYWSRHAMIAACLLVISIHHEWLYWFRHTVIGPWLLVISIHHEWLWLISTHGDWCMTSSDFYSQWATHGNWFALTGVRIWEGTNRLSYIVMDSYTYSERSYTKAYLKWCHTHSLKRNVLWA